MGRAGRKEKGLRGSGRQKDRGWLLEIDVVMWESVLQRTFLQSKHEITRKWLKQRTLFSTEKPEIARWIIASWALCTGFMRNVFLTRFLRLLLYAATHIWLAVFPKRSTYCTVSQTKSLNGRSLPVSVVINPEECFVCLNKQTWSGVGPLALLQSQFSVISCSHTVPAAMGKSK